MHTIPCVERKDTLYIYGYSKTAIKEYVIN